MNELPTWENYLKRGLWELMVNLVYPAVLGSVLYIALDYMTRVFVPKALAPPNLQTLPLDAVAAAKVTLLLLTITFYCCDYLYLRWTVRFQVIFFVFDMLFLLGLYLTIVFTHVQVGDADLPQAHIVAALFTLFMLFYLWWDLGERKLLTREAAGLNLQPTEADIATINEASRKRICRLKVEIPLYSSVITWERVSIVLFILAVGVGWLRRGSLAGVWSLISVLAIVTGWFVRLICRKAKVHYEHPAASHQE